MPDRDPACCFKRENNSRYLTPSAGGNCAEFPAWSTRPSNYMEHGRQAAGLPRTTLGNNERVELCGVATATQHSKTFFQNTFEKSRRREKLVGKLVKGLAGPCRTCFSSSMKGPCSQHWQRPIGPPRDNYGLTSQVNQFRSIERMNDERWMIGNGTASLAYRVSQLYWRSPLGLLLQSQHHVTGQTIANGLRETCEIFRRKPE